MPPKYKIPFRYRFKYRAFLSYLKVEGQDFRFYYKWGGKKRKFKANVSKFCPKSAKVGGQLPPLPPLVRNALYVLRN